MLHRVCPAEELADGGCRRAEFEGRAVLVAIVDGDPYAVSDTCLHREGRLSDGVFRDGVVTCPEHWWRYDVTTGARTDEPSQTLESYPARIEEGWVVVDFPPAEPARSLREVLLAHARGLELDARVTDPAAASDA